jgi:HPt (histidine-containing phosphotransfer) domain-containing protein
MHSFSADPSEPTENLEKLVQRKLRRRYLDRLAQRVRRIRKQMAEREWPELRMECHQLRGSGEAFGFSKLTELAAKAEEAIPATASVTVRALSTEARHAVEALVRAIDEVLSTEET